MDGGACCRLLSMGSQRVGHDWATSLSLSRNIRRGDLHRRPAVLTLLYTLKCQYVEVSKMQRDSESKYTIIIWERTLNNGSSLLSVQFSCSVVSDSLRPHGLQHSGLPVHHKLLEFTQTRVHWVSDAIQPSHPLSSPSPSAFNLSQHQGLFKWVSFLHQVEWS